MNLGLIEDIGHGIIIMADYPIFGGYNKRQNVDFDSEDLVNLYMIKDFQGKKKFAFLGTPGLAERLVVREGNYESRALFKFNKNLMYGVCGSDVYAFYPTVNSIIGVKKGSIETSSGYVSITANNASQIIFVDGKSGFLATSDTSFVKITDSGFPPFPLNVAFLDGYFVIPSGDTISYQISALNDGTKWKALDKANINAYGGNNVGVGVVNRRLFFFKESTTEIWYNAGTSDFPFRRDNNLIFNYGCLSASSIASEFGYLFWLASDISGVGSVMMTEGNEAKKISNASIDDLISTMSNPKDVSTYIYKDGEHIFYVMNWTTDDITLVYDLTMDLWHRMDMLPSIYNPSIPYSGKTRHLGNCHAYFNETHYVGSYKNSTIYEFSKTFYENAGEQIRRRRVCPHFFDESYKMMQIERIQIDMQMGIGTNSGSYPVTLYPEFYSIDPGVNPKVTLKKSIDGGYVYGNEREASIGRIGNNLKRAIFRQLGQCRDLVSEISFYAPTGPVAILGASIEYKVLSK